VPCSYLISSFDQHLAVAGDADGAAAAYQNTMINTVLVPSPLAGVFNTAAMRLSADEIDQCASYLECLHPSQYASFALLTPAQQDLILEVKDKEPALVDIFHAVVGNGAYIDVSRYVQTRRGVMRTAIPHIDECDTHMTATILGQRGTLLYKRGYAGVGDAAFKKGGVIISPCDVIETAPSQLCFIKGSDHGDVVDERTQLNSRWHGSPIITDTNEARIGNFFAMRNGLGECRNYG
jgi:hypothetical protein